MPSAQDPLAANSTAVLTTATRGPISRALRALVLSTAASLLAVVMLLVRYTSAPTVVVFSTPKSLSQAAPQLRLRQLLPLA
jgi:hypothetical protein